MNPHEISTRILKAGGAVGCALGAYGLLFIAAMSRSKVALALAGGAAITSLTLGKQALAGYKAESDSD